MKRCCLGALLIVASVISYSQTADQIISKHIEATGGADNWKKVKTLYMEGVTVLPDGNEVYSRIYKVHNMLFRREVKFGNDTSTMIINDKRGWYSNPETKRYDSMPFEMYKTQVKELDIAGPLFDYKTKGHQVMLIGKDSINNSETYQLKVQLDTAIEVMYHIDTKSYYLIRQSFKPGADGLGGIRHRPGADPELPVVIDFADFKKIKGGYVFPFTVTSPAMGGSIRYDRIEVNLPVDADKLKRPPVQTN